jgi:Ca-activated chloride channel family protein
MNYPFFKKTHYYSEAAIIVVSAIILMMRCSMSSDGIMGGNLPYNTDDNSNPVFCPDFNTEEYATLSENPFLSVSSNPLSTFSIDVDAASYSNCRRYINEGSLPPSGATRLEEFINYFKYEYPEPQGSDPVGAHIEIAECPWDSGHTLAKIGIKARTIPQEQLPPARLTFLLDVSGSMADNNKLPLIKQAFTFLLEKLREQDRVAIVVYASSTGVVLQPTSGDQKSQIQKAIDKLQAAGSTAGGAGINLAYNIAESMYSEDASNRVILATDGDFNVGESSNAGLVELIKQKRNKGIFLTVLGFGMGNYKDSKMEALADNGNGNYAYIDGIEEAKRVFLNEFSGTIFTVAKDVKIQVEFNPASVKSYRLIGYENRLLKNDQFKNDTVDAGEVGSGQTVTAFYELIPASSSETIPGTDSLRYQVTTTPSSPSEEFFYVKIRYKDPDGSESKLITQPAGKECFSSTPSSDFHFAASVAEFGLLLRPSQFKGSASYSHVISVAEKNIGTDLEGYRKEFVALVRKAQTLTDIKYGD